jgi:hypothetical protein
MRNVASWHELHTCDSLREAMTIATSIEAMEFDARICRLATGEPIVDGEAEEVGPYVVEVPLPYARELLEVIDLIIEEQREFDAFLDEVHAAASRRQRQILLGLIGVVGVLAALGYIEL